MRRKLSGSLPFLLVAAVCVVAVALPALGVWPWILFVWYAGGFIVTLTLLALLPLIVRYIGRPFGEDLGGGSPATLAARLRAAATVWTDLLWRSLSWPLTTIIFVTRPGLIGRFWDESPAWVLSDELFSIGLAIRYEPWVAVFCCAQAVGTVAIAFRVAYPIWLGFGAVGALIGAVVFRDLRYIVGVDLPTALRRAYGRPYVVFAITAALDLIALAIALVVFRSLLHGTPPSLGDVVPVTKAMFSTTALTALVTGRPAPIDQVLCDVVGKVWGIALLRYALRFYYFRRTDADRRETSLSLVGQGKFEEAIAEIHAIDSLNRTGVDRNLEAICTICTGRVEAGLELRDKLLRFEGVEPPTDIELFTFLFELVTGSPVGSAARAEMIVYAAGKFGDVWAVVFADRAVIGDVVRRRDALAVAPRLERFPLTLATLMVGVDAYREASAIESYIPADRVETFLKEYLLGVAASMRSGLPPRRRRESFLAAILPLFEAAASYSDDEIMYVRLFLVGACAVAEGVHSEYGPVFRNVLARYDNALADHPDHAALVERSAVLGGAMRDYVQRIETLTRVETATDDAFEALTSRARRVASAIRRGATRQYGRLRVFVRRARGRS
jgi:hypothetical protein